MPAAMLGLAVHKHDVVRPRPHHIAAHLRDVIGVAAHIEDEVSAVCVEDEGELVLMLVPQAEGADIEEEVVGLAPPVRAHHSPAGPGEEVGELRGRLALLAVGADPAEVLALGEVVQSLSKLSRHVDIPRVIHMRDVPVRRHRPHPRGPHALEARDVVVRQPEVVELVDLRQPKEVAQSDVVVAGRELLLWPIRVHLDVQLSRQARNGLLAPRLGELQLREQHTDVPHPVGFHRQPVPACGVPAQVLGLLGHRLHHHDDVIVG